MLHRRHLLAAAATPLLATKASAAQSQYPAGGDYGAPQGTSPFSPEVYRERRQRLMAQLKSGVVVLYGAEAPVSDSPTAPRFRQNEDFAWLTGIVDEPGAVLVLAPAERSVREWLLLPSRNPEAERWERERLPLGQEIERRTGFQRVLRRGGLGGLVTGLASRSGELHYLGPIVSTDAPAPKELELYGKIAARVPGARTVNSTDVLWRMRMVKEARELDLIRKAIAATGRGLKAGMRAVRPGMTEYQLKEIIEAEFRAAGARELAFDSIVAAGRNNASLHYTAGDGPIRSGQLVLADVGAEVGHYASDITRTFPVDGRFTPEHRQVYEVVLRAQEAARAKLKAGVMYEDLVETARNVIRQAGYIDAFYHGLGHFVGLNVHEGGDYAKPLLAGAVITIEPGIYLQDRGFGVRIEDDFLITASGSEHLSRDIPRTVAEIEAAMAGRSG
jgi:Xaa-Pro aminopeptidase